ncbi:MAG TPA: baseplate J/gp47 family protein [Candidatus Saccharimonadales bacterium]|nr:baseplate J/gp47 family protein [Candidatus Saccharimonadales bacterium]
MSADKIDKAPAKPGKETIYIDVDDEITGIIDKVEAAKQKVVALVLPKRATSLQSIVNMRLLKRSADNAGKNVVLITSEEALMPLAGAAGLHVAKNLQSRPMIPVGPEGPGAPTPAVAAKDTVAEEPADGGAEADLPPKINYDKSIGELATAHDLEHPETIELGDDEDPVEAAAASTEKLPKAPKNRALKVPNFDKFRLFLGLGIVGLITLIVFIFLAVKVLPKATIAITTTSTPVSANFQLATSGSAKSYDSAKGVIPGYSQKKDQTSSQQVQATGQQNNGQKASGTVTLSLTDCSQSSVTIPAGSGLSSSDLTFITQKSVTLNSVVVGGQCENSSFPQQSSADVNVVANQGGTKYNIPANSDFTVAGSGYSSVTGNNSNAFSGGTDDIQTVVSQADVETAKQKLSPSDTDKFAKDFEDNLSSQGYYVLTSTLKQSDPSVTSSPAIGQAATNVTVTLKITYTVLAVKQDDLKAAINHELANQIDKSKQKLDDTEVLKDASVDVTNQSSSTGASLNITENTSAIPLIDAASIKNMSAGKKSGVITSEVSSIPGVKSVKVNLSPFWVSKVPTKHSKITVTIQHVANGS